MQRRYCEWMLVFIPAGARRFGPEPFLKYEVRSAKYEVGITKYEVWKVLLTLGSVGDFIG